MLRGKHYNRAWSVHECFSEAMHRLFIEKEASNLSLTEEFSELIMNVKNKTSCNSLLQHPDFQAFKSEYDSLKGVYLSGAKGKTAQYWSFYSFLVELQQQFHYSINMNDFY